eukprot:TRINITY_DN15993_c0_g4_i1.p1 TRINITY_DN15993_c0_g4~~TRINITY_DN15993_c0_g4_i1.p1  ORF type:complete len:508 (+),score=65.33 TRINITY_DN15993_c0_g4_i1:40-1524(+)
MVLCCLCGVEVPASAATGARCVQCLQKDIDIVAGISRRVHVQNCGTCGRWLKPGGSWVVADPESRELLGVCLKSIKGITKDHQLVDASFIWTEPHSKELKVRLQLQQEAMKGVVVQQGIVVELRIDNLQCNDCKKTFTKHTWDSCVQVRQRSEHRRTLAHLEQLILQHKAHSKLIELANAKDGVDFFFNREKDAQDFVAFVKNYAVVKHHESKQLLSHNAQSSTYRFKRTTCIELCPVCKDDIVFLPPKIAQSLGGLPPLMVCTKVASLISLVDPATSRYVEVSAADYWRKPFFPVATPAKLTEFVVLDVIPDEAGRANLSNKARSSTGAKAITPCDMEIARASDFGQTDELLTVRCHLGSLLHVGDIALGYDLRTLYIGLDDAELGGTPPLEVYLIRKQKPPKEKRKPAGNSKSRGGKNKSQSSAGMPSDEQKDQEHATAVAEAGEGDDLADEEEDEDQAEMRAAAEKLLSRIDAEESETPAASPTGHEKSDC